MSNSFAASATKYAQAAAMISGMLQRAEAHVDGLADAIEALREAQIDTEFSGPEKRARLKTLEAEAIAEMRALLALDPARAIRAAAASIVAGVPTQSQANARSAARIAEISTEMRLYAGQLEGEADRIAALSPALPEQVTLSTAQRLLATAWRLPALTMAALLLDLCGWIAVGFRLALYQALRAKLREENERTVPNYVTLDDFSRVEEFVRRTAESRRRIEGETGAPKRGRPRLTKPAAKLPKPETKPGTPEADAPKPKPETGTRTPRTPKTPKGGKSDDKG